MSPTPPAHFLLRLCVDAENAGLPEGKTRCWLFQKFVRTHDVVQVKNPALTHYKQELFRLFMKILSLAGKYTSGISKLRLTFCFVVKLCFKGELQHSHFEMSVYYSQ